MKKGILKITILSLMIALGSVACSTSDTVIGPATPDSKPSASGTPSMPTPSSALPALPTPVSSEAELKAAHKKYAEVTKASELGVSMCWADSRHESQFEYLNGVLFFNDFLKFAYCVDPVVREQLGFAKAHNKNAHQYLDSGNLSQLEYSVGYLTATNRFIKERILKATEIYGIPVSNLAPTYSTLDPIFIQLTKNQSNFYGPISTRIMAVEKTIFPTDGDEVAYNLLLESVTLAFKNLDGSIELFSFENFMTPKDSPLVLAGIIFAFEPGQGGFGEYNLDQVRFLD